MDVVALATKQGSWEAAAEDALMSTMRYANGVLVQTHDAFTVAYAPTGLHVIGEDGAIFATDVMTQEPDRGPSSCATRDGEREIDIPNRRDLYEISVGRVRGRRQRRGTSGPSSPASTGSRPPRWRSPVRQAAESGERVAL